MAPSRRPRLPRRADLQPTAPFTRPIPVGRPGPRGPLSRLLGRWAYVASHYPRRTLIVLGLLTLLAGLLAKDVRFDEQFSSLVSGSGPEAAVRDEYRQTWGTEDGVLIAVIHADQPLPHLPVFVERITDRVGSDVPDVVTVVSATNAPVVAPDPAKDGAGKALGPAFGPTSPFEGSLAERVALLRGSGLGSTSLVSADGQTFAVLAALGPGHETYDQLKEPATRFRAVVDDEVVRSRVPISATYSGLAFNRLASVEQVRTDLLRLLPAAGVLCTAILWLVFRRISAVIAPLLSVVVAVAVGAAMMRLAGASINGVTTVYPVLLMGVVVSSSTHLVHRFFTERGAGRDPTAAAHATLCSVGRAAFVAAATTAAGFASLASAHLALLREFGVQLALGVMAAFAIQCTLIPAFLAWRQAEPTERYLRLGSTGAIPLADPVLHSRVGRLTDAYARWITRPVVALGALAVTALLAVLCLSSFRNVQYDYRLADGVDPSSDVGRGNALVDQELGGIIPLEVSLVGPVGSMTTVDSLRRQEELARWIETSYGTRPVSLPALLAEEVALVTGGPAALPAEQPAVDLFVAAARRFGDGTLVGSVLTEDGARTRMRGVVPDQGAQRLLEIRQELEAHAAQVFAGTGVRVHLTGSAPAAYAGMRNLSSELITSTILALAVIVLAILLVFRNGWMALIGVLPNSIPVVVGLAGYRLAAPAVNPVASIVFCITVGLAADDTIHLIGRWREIAQTRDHVHPDHSRRALVSALVMARQAMISSTLVLIAGFAVLTLSTLRQNRELGLLGAYVLALALVADIVAGTAGIAILAAIHDRRARRRRAQTSDRATAIA